MEPIGNATKELDRLLGMLPLSPQKLHASSAFVRNKDVQRLGAKKEQFVQRLSPLLHKTTGLLEDRHRPISPPLMPVTVEVFLSGSCSVAIGTVVADDDWNLYKLRKQIKASKFAGKLPAHWRFCFSDGVGILTDQERVLQVQRAKGAVYITSKVAKSKPVKRVEAAATDATETPTQSAKIIDDSQVMNDSDMATVESVFGSISALSQTSYPSSSSPVRTSHLGREFDAFPGQSEMSSTEFSVPSTTTGMRSIDSSWKFTMTLDNSVDALDDRSAFTFNEPEICSHPTTEEDESFPFITERPKAKLGMVDLADETFSQPARELIARCAATGEIDILEALPKPTKEGMLKKNIAGCCTAVERALHKLCERPTGKEVNGIDGWKCMALVESERFDFAALEERFSNAHHELGAAFRSVKTGLFGSTRSNFESQSLIPLQRWVQRTSAPRILALSLAMARGDTALRSAVQSLTQIEKTDAQKDWPYSSPSELYEFCIQLEENVFNALKSYAFAGAITNSDSFLNAHYTAMKVRRSGIELCLKAAQTAEPSMSAGEAWSLAKRNDGKSLDTLDVTFDDARPEVASFLHVALLLATGLRDLIANDNEATTQIANISSNSSAGILDLYRKEFNKIKSWSVTIHAAKAAAALQASVEAKATAEAAEAARIQTEKEEEERRAAEAKATAEAAEAARIQAEKEEEERRAAEAKAIKEEAEERRLKEIETLRAENAHLEKLEKELEAEIKKTEEEYKKSANYKRREST